MAFKQWGQDHQAQAETKTAQTIAKKAEAHELKAQTIDGERLALRAEIARLRAEMARVRGSHPGEDPAVPEDNQDPTQSVQASMDLAPLVQKLSEKSDIDDREIEELQAANEDRRAEAEHWRKAAESSRPRRWAAGAVFGTTPWGDEARGMFVDRDFSIFRTGAEVTRNSYADRRMGWEVRLRVGVCF
jgi:hypothetical protein